MGTAKERIDNLDPHSNGEKQSLLVAKESLYDPRKERIEWWRSASEGIMEYEGNNATDKDGNTYWYGPGLRLLIGDPEKGEAIEVVDSCETPWAVATVDRAFEELRLKSGELRVLERGFGMGIIARKVIQNLIPRGGSYTVIELNRKNAEYAMSWRGKEKIGLTNIAVGMPATKPNIAIEIIEGEAYEETAKLAESGRKFDIIISDTYPLTEDEQGMNDLQDLDVLKRCLEPNGVFTFFVYFPGSPDEMAYKQAAMVTRHFANYSGSRVNVNPPPDYKYLQTATGPIRSLPVVICKNPTP